ncbi:hypothetical protein RirG_257000 [Rhizophagus irregularis DAOM 197198w]|uniref:Uncharacterized protein n=1 Tax=Rhizophagus irregularis (strain DAOM 197198w) TaxID=1432141 RepID=A0A015IDJ6_RHIIW|nr:hypothetical protein RirG_257000 [Rhizophagus irregularis DAOM 197198w]
MRKTRKERVSSLGTAISAISKNVKTRKDIINQADLSRVKYQFRLGLTRLIDSFGALGFSFGFSFWVLDRYRLLFYRYRLWLLHGTLDRWKSGFRLLDVGLISGLDSWMLDRCWLRFFNLGYRL